MKEERCPNCPCRDLDFVPGRGDPGAKIVFIGEGPGEVERELGTPFSGQSGELLHSTWLQIVEEKEGLKGYETNAYLCFPKEDSSEESSAIRVCRGRLLNTLKGIQPKVVVAMGGAAIQALLDKEKVIPHIWQLQSSPFLDFPHTVIPTFNPASILRNPGQYRTFSDCLELANRLAAGLLPPPPLLETHVARNLEDVRSFLQELEPYTTLVLDLETTRLDPFTDHILTLCLSPLPPPISSSPSPPTFPLSLSPSPNSPSLPLPIPPNSPPISPSSYSPTPPPQPNQYQTFIIPWRLLVRKEELLPEVWKQIPREGFSEVKEFLEDPTRSYLVHNTAFDQNFLRAAGIEVKVMGDPMLLHYATDERTDRWAGHGLKPLAAQYLGIPDWEGPIWSYLKSKNDSFEKIPEDVLHEYCQWDTPHTGELYRELWSRADAGELKLYQERLLPLQEMLSSCQARGIYIDIPLLLGLRKEAQEDLEKLDQLLQDICGLPTFNPGSTMQAQDVLFKDFGLSRPVDPETGGELRGSGEPVLLALLRGNQEFLKRVASLEEEGEAKSLTHLVAALSEENRHFAFILGLLVRRDAAKDISTYFDGVAKFISPYDRCIHPFTHVTGTDTGRFTGSRPSLLNVKNVNRVKMPYSARPGYLFGYSDQSQFELRVFACRTKDRVLADLLKESDEKIMRCQQERGLHDCKHHDIHTLVGRMVFPYFDQSPKWWRAIVKTVVYGVLYGRSAYALAKRYHLEVQEAEEYRQAILDLFPRVREYEAEIVQEIRSTQQVSTPFGRRKRFPFLPSDRKGWTHIKNAGMNMPIQSIASDLNSFSMYDIWKSRHETGIYPLFPIHDAITFELPEDRVEESLAYIKKVMETAPVRYLGSDYSYVPFKVDPHASKHWGEISEEEGFFAQVMALVEKEE